MKIKNKLINKRPKIEINNKKEKIIFFFMLK